MLVYSLNMIRELENMQTVSNEAVNLTHTVLSITGDWLRYGLFHLRESFDVRCST
jgi:hypothetical protein